MRGGHPQERDVNNHIRESPKDRLSLLSLPSNVPTLVPLNLPFKTPQKYTKFNLTSNPFISHSACRQVRACVHACETLFAMGSDSGLQSNSPLIVVVGTRVHLYIRVHTPLYDERVRRYIPSTRECAVVRACGRTHSCVLGYTHAPCLTRGAFILEFWLKKEGIEWRRYFQIFSFHPASLPYFFSISLFSYAGPKKTRNS